MRRQLFLRRLATGAIAAMLAASAWGLYPNNNQQGHSEVIKVKPRMTTVCVGRFTLDVPEGSEIQFRSARIAGVDVVVRPGYTEAQLQLDIGDREHELAQLQNDYDRPSLEKKLHVDAKNFPSTLLYFGRKKPMVAKGYKPAPGTEEGIGVEGYGFKDGTSYLFRGKNLGSPLYENNVLDLVKRFEARPNDSIPTQPGFCTDRGFVHDPTPADDNEAVAMFASPKGHPDIAIRLDTSINMTRIEESLLSRDAHNRVKREHASRFTHFRKGARELNGIPGEEVLSKVKEFNGTSVHGFMWVGLGKMNDVLAPTLTLELETGKGAPGEPVNSSMSDEEVLQLWESISSSLKVRPTSTKTDRRSSTFAPPVALGELAATGQPCPQTGFWECKESANVEGGSRRLITEGEQMPPALMRPKSGMWEKFRGLTSSKPISTVWRLVDYGTISSDGSAVAQPVELDRPCSDQPGPANVA